MTRARADDGFSLIELLVVVAITSVLAIGVSLALPRGQDPLLTAATDLERAARDLRARAMLSGAPTRLDAQSIARTGGVTISDAAWRFASDGSVSGPPLVLSRSEDRMVCRTVNGSFAKCARD